MAEQQRNGPNQLHPDFNQHFTVSSSHSFQVHAAFEKPPTHLDKICVCVGVDGYIENG